MSGIYYALAFLPKHVSSDIFRRKTIISAVKYFCNTYLWFDLKWHNFLTSFLSFNRLSLKKKKRHNLVHSNFTVICLFGVGIPCLRLSQKYFFKLWSRECINLQKGSLRKKMYLNSTFKGCIFVLKHFDPSQECKQWQRNVHNFTRSAHTISMLLRLRRDFFIRKLDRKKGLIYMLLCKDFVKFDV